MAHALGRATRELAEDQDVRAVVVSSSHPKAFCVGADLKERNAFSDEELRAQRPLAQAAYRGVLDLPVPVVAAVDGPALGAGLDLALTCDLRLATGNAVFASSWISVGLVPGMGGAHLLTRAVGSSRASEMVLLGRRVGPEEALDWGLVNEVVAADELDARVDALGTHLAGLSAAALARSKASLRRAAADSFAAELAVLGTTQASLLTDRGFREATARFRQ